ETSLEHARGQATAISTDERRGVDPDRHREARLVYTDDGERAWIVRICERLADRHLREAGDGDQLAGTRILDLDPIECLGHIQGCHLRSLDPAVGAAPSDLLAIADGALADAAEGESPDVGRRVEVRDVR